MTKVAPVEAEVAIEVLPARAGVAIAVLPAGAGVAIEVLPAGAGVMRVMRTVDDVCEWAWFCSWTSTR